MISLHRYPGRIYSIPPIVLFAKPYPLRTRDRKTGASSREKRTHDGWVGRSDLIHLSLMPSRLLSHRNSMAHSSDLERLTEPSFPAMVKFFEPSRPPGKSTSASRGKKSALRSTCTDTQHSPRDDGDISVKYALSGEVDQGQTHAHPHTPLQLSTFRNLSGREKKLVCLLQICRHPSAEAIHLSSLISLKRLNWIGRNNAEGYNTSTR
jgi:hypothetical protein